MASSDTSFLSQFKPKTIAGWALSALFFVGSLLVQYGASRTHTADEIKQLQTDVASLKSQMANDMATRREVDEVKATVNRIEDKLDRLAK